MLCSRTQLSRTAAITLLPEGEARVQPATELDIEATGHKKHVALYAVTGLDFSPTYFWAEASDKFFASVDTWGTVVPEGWESSAPTLLAAQNKIKESRAADLAAKLAHHPNAILFTHANVFDAKSGKIVPDRDVLIIGNRVARVGRPQKGSFPIPQPSDHEIWSERVPGLEPQIIDAIGKTLLPGLWDMHAHVTDNDGLLNLSDLKL